MDAVGIDKVIVSNKVSFKKGYKNFIDYKMMEKLYHNVTCFHKRVCARNFDGTKYVFLQDMANCKKNKKSGIKSALKKILIVSKPVDNKKYLKTKIQFYESKIWNPPKKIGGGYLWGVQPNGEFSTIFHTFLVGQRTKFVYWF